MKKITLSEAKKLALLITGKHPSCALEFDSKIISNFFIKSGVDISEISKYRNDEIEPFYWVIDFLKDFFDTENCQYILKKYFEEAKFTIQN